MNDFHLQISSRVRFFNIGRRVFRFGWSEQWLASRTRGADTDSPWVRLIPPNYLYSRPSVRDVNLRGVNYSLDISDYLEHAVYFGYIDPGLEELFRLAKGKQTVIDVGVNLGYVSLNLARLCPDGRVIGFEPDPDNFRKAKNNLSLNDFRNVEFHNIGLGETPGKARLYAVNADNRGMNRILKDNDAQTLADKNFVDIEIVRLDDFAAENSIKNVDLIKIDVEGYELKVLRGSEKLLKSAMPILYVEVDDQNLKAQGDRASELVSYLRQFGYYTYRADSGDEVLADQLFDNCHFDLVAVHNTEI